MTKLRGCAIGTVFVVGAALGARGCGGVTDDRAAARDRTANAICDRYTQCELIGSDMGDSYPTRESCMIAWRANREEAWPAADCQGKISQPDLNVCLSAIAATACMGFDFVTTLLKCTSATVCSAGMAPDGG